MRTWMLSLALAGLVLSGGPVASSALTVTIGSDEMGFQQFDEDALGCTSAGPNGQLACSGQIDGPGGPSGGWTVESYDMFLDPDPTVSNQMVVTNNTAVPQDFLVTVVLPVTVTFGPPSLITGSVGGSATDRNGDGVTLNTIGSTAVYTAAIDNVSVRTLLNAPFSTSAGGFGTAPVGPTNFGIPTAESVGVATTTNIGITLRFRLSPFDSAALTSVFNVVPEPGTALLLGSGILALFAFGRRHSRD